MEQNKKLPYLVEVYCKWNSKKGERDEKKLSDCVVWALNSGNALRKVQEYYPPAQHNYIVKGAKKLNVDIADLSQTSVESVNLESIAAEEENTSQ
jgi:hypothetical protein